MKTNNLVKLAISLFIPLLIGLGGSAVTFKEILGWYVNLNKPQLIPPNGVFGPVWTVLYILMGMALYLFWVSKGKNKKKGFVFFGAQLLLNFLWSYLFFGLHSPALAVGEIFLLLITIILNIKEFNKYSKVAAGLLVPYLLWVSFATYLTFSVWRLN